MAYGRNDVIETSASQKKETKLQSLVQRLDIVLRNIDRNNTRLYSVIENADGSRIEEARDSEMKVPQAPSTLSRLNDITTRLEGVSERLDAYTTDIEHLF